MDEKAALKEVVRAWEALPGGPHSVDRIQRWLVDEMKPAMDLARKTLRLPIPTLSAGASDV